MSFKIEACLAIGTGSFASVASPFTDLPEYRIAFRQMAVGTTTRRARLSRARLSRFAQNHTPPQSWYDEDMSDMF
jgi:hypothetical protein